MKEDSKRTTVLGYNSFRHGIDGKINATGCDGCDRHCLGHDRERSDDRSDGRAHTDGASDRSGISAKRDGANRRQRSRYDHPFLRRDGAA